MPLMMFRLGVEENEYILCPYDKGHNIRIARMQVHLIKCRKNHPSTELATCPFNILHVVQKVELDVHVKICPERLSFELFCHQDKPANDNECLNATSVDNTTLQTFSNASLHSSNWDDDHEVPTYNPTDYAKKALVLRDPRGMTPSERREFRAKERERLQKNSTF